MKPQHTPGPWHAGVKPSGFVYDSKGAQIADCQAMLGIEEAKANVRLIAAAPELLELLAQLADALAECQDYAYHDLDPVEKPPYADIIDMAQTAINKARGA